MMRCWFARLNYGHRPPRYRVARCPAIERYIVGITLQEITLV